MWSRDPLLLREKFCSLGIPPDRGLLHLGGGFVCLFVCLGDIMSLLLLPSSVLPSSPLLWGLHSSSGQVFLRGREGGIFLHHCLEPLSHYSDLCHYGLVLPVPEPYINGIIHTLYLPYFAQCFWDKSSLLHVSILHSWSLLCSLFQCTNIGIPRFSAFHFIVFHRYCVFYKLVCSNHVK